MITKGKKYKIVMAKKGHIDYIGYISEQDGNFITLVCDGESPIMININQIKTIQETEAEE